MIYEETAIFGRVEILEEYGSEEEARRAGYTYDAHVYRRNEFGAKEPVMYKVMARATNFVQRDYARVKTRVESRELRVE